MYKLTRNPVPTNVRRELNRLEAGKIDFMAIEMHSPATSRKSTSLVSSFSHSYSSLSLFRSTPISQDKIVNLIKSRSIVRNRSLRDVAMLLPGDCALVLYKYCKVENSPTSTDS